LIKAVESGHLNISKNALLTVYPSKGPEFYQKSMQLSLLNKALTAACAQGLADFG
jgi:hypothetical protein